MNKKDITVIICCAGMGTRLGIGSTKALADICGTPLIIRQLEMLKDFDDVRIVVGYQAERVIDLVNCYRKDIMYAFNYDFATTGPAESLAKAMVCTRKYVVAIDGDLLTNPADLIAFMNYPGECLGVSMPSSDEPVYVIINEDQEAVGFSEEQNLWEWSGIAKIRADRLQLCKNHVFKMIEPILPIKAFPMRARDLDTPDDYVNMIEWFEQGCEN